MEYTEAKTEDVKKLFQDYDEKHKKLMECLADVPEDNLFSDVPKASLWINGLIGRAQGKMILIKHRLSALF